MHGLFSILALGFAVSALRLYSEQAYIPSLVFAVFATLFSVVTMLSICSAKGVRVERETVIRFVSSLSLITIGLYISHTGFLALFEGEFEGALYTILFGAGMSCLGVFIFRFWKVSKQSFCKTQGV